MPSQKDGRPVLRMQEMGNDQTQRMAEVRMLELCRRKHGKVTKENEMSVLSEINELVKKAQARPMYQTGIAVPLSLYGGTGRILWGGGKLDVGPDGKPKASVGGIPVRKWEDLPSTKMMFAASNPKVNTPAVRMQKMMAYNLRPRKPTRLPPGTSMPGASSAQIPKFDFRGEAIKLLKSYGANASKAKGGYSTDIGRNMIRQWKDIQANPQNYDEAKQRQILDQWKSNIAQMRTGSSQNANPQSIASSPRKQQPVAQKPQGVTTVRRTWSGIPGSAGQPQWAADALAKVENARKKKLLNGLP